MQGVVTGETLFLFSPDINNYVEVFFWAQDLNGMVDAGDYCTVHFLDIPLWLHGSIQIFYEFNGGSICSAQFIF